MESTVVQVIPKIGRQRSERLFLFSSALITENWTTRNSVTNSSNYGKVRKQTTKRLRYSEIQKAAVKNSNLTLNPFWPFLKQGFHWYFLPVFPSPVLLIPQSARPARITNWKVGETSRSTPAELTLTNPETEKRWL